MSSVNKFEQERHQLVKKLLLEVPTINNNQQRLLAINQIAATILRSRPLCRRFNGTPLNGVYQEIYLQAKKQITNHISQYLILSESHEETKLNLNIKQLAPGYLYELQTSIFQKILDDEQLKKMGLAAQSFLINSELRTYALTELVRAIKLSGRLCRPHVQKFSANLYQTIYEEAVTETLCYVCLNIDLYDPNRGNKKFINWVNFKLDKSVLKCYERHNRYAKFEIPSSQILEQTKQPENVPDISQIIREYLIQDPDDIFLTTHIRNRSDANFTKIALAKFSGQSWENISQQLDIPVPTLSSFYNRWCRRFAPLLNTELKKYF